jgi:putative membrane protein
MGNYQLVMIDAVNDRNLGILIPVGNGAAGGLIVFSHILSWVFKKYRNQTISLLTGFILGSLSVLWPWQKAVYLLDNAGEMLLKRGEPIVSHYQKFLPEVFNMEVFLAILFAVIGIISIWLIEKVAAEK